MNERLVDKLYRLATPLTTGLFLVSAVSGVMLFFHVGGGAFHEIHEWLSLALVVPAGLHVAKNWSSLVAYAKRGALTVPVMGAVVAAIVMGVMPRDERGPKREAARQALEVLTDAKLTDLAPLLRTTPAALRDKLESRGYQVNSVDQSLLAIAATTGAPPAKVLGELLPPRP